MSTFVGIGISDKKDPFLAASEAAKAALYQIHHKEITLAILFSSIHFSDQRLLDGISYTLGNVKLIGCSGAALISSSRITKYGVGIMLISSDKIKFSMASASDINTKGARLAGEQFAHEALKNLKTPQRDLAIIFPDGLVENSQTFCAASKTSWA